VPKQFSAVHANLHILSIVIISNTCRNESRQLKALLAEKDIERMGHIVQIPAILQASVFAPECPAQAFPSVLLQSGPRMSC
jgi:hypothetical protein